MLAMTSSRDASHSASVRSGRPCNSTGHCLSSCTCAFHGHKLRPKLAAISCSSCTGRAAQNTQFRCRHVCPPSATSGTRCPSCRPGWWGTRSRPALPAARRQAEGACGPGMHVHPFSGRDIWTGAAGPGLAAGRQVRAGGSSPALQQRPQQRDALQRLAQPHVVCQDAPWTAADQIRACGLRHPSCKLGCHGGGPHGCSVAASPHLGRTSAAAR